MEIKKILSYIKNLDLFFIFNIKIHVFFKKSDLYLLRNRRTTDWARDDRTARPLISTGPVLNLGFF